MIDESRLISEASKGDLDAFNRLVLAYQEPAYNLAYRILWDEDSAEDATQNAFISAFRNIKNYRGGSFRAWIFRIVTNNCYDELRRRKRHPETQLEPLGKDNDEELESPAWVADGKPSPEQTLEELDLEHAIQHCIGNLPDDFRSVVIMVDMEEMDYSEVSQAIGKPLGTVKSRIARARVRLRECLQKFGELLPEQFRLDVEESI
jgi:RNA polymerase sigma-70 factor, ECF subfamily